MRLIQQLNEASSLSIEDIKKVLSKDEHCKVILKKDAALKDIVDKEKFLATIKYYVLNNQNVLAFVDARSNVKDLSMSLIRELRQLKASELNDTKFDLIKSTVASIFKENNSVNKGTLSASTRKEIADWVNGNRGYHNLSKATEKELLSVASVRSDKPVRLYRGLLFKGYSLSQREHYDGTLDKGNGLKFLDAIRSNGKEVDLEWDRASSWTTSKETADRFARFAAASSNFGAMFNALSRGVKFIDGDLGFVISILAKPEDVLLDVSKVQLSATKYNEAEFILAPGKYHCRITNKYTVTGEVPLESDETESLQRNLTDAVDRASELKKKYSLDQFDKLHDENQWSLFKNQVLIKKLASSETTDLCLHTYDAYLDFYRSISLKSFDHTKTNNTELIDKIKKMKASFHSHFEQKAGHSKSKDGEKVHSLSYSEYRATMVPFYDLNNLEKEIIINQRVTKDSLDSFSKMALFANITLSNNFSKLSAANQKEDLTKVINTFLATLNIDVSESFETNAKKAINLFKRIARNYVTITKLRYFQDAL